jgi:hypothetical protein
VGVLAQNGERVHTQRVPTNERPSSIGRSIQVLIGSEVFGVEVFARAERHARTPADRHLWGALHELETQTRLAVFARLSADIDRLRANQHLAKAVGVASGAAMPMLPKRLQLRSVVLGAKPFLSHFERLNAHFAATPDAAFFAYVLAHERAIIEVGRLALAGEANAVGPVVALLGRVPG